MVHTAAITAAAALLIALPLPVNAGLYSKNSPVVQVDARNYDRLIAQSNYTSVFLPLTLFPQ
jgi:protein disulfide-isomerase A6